VDHYHKRLQRKIAAAISVRQKRIVDFATKKDRELIKSLLASVKKLMEDKDILEEAKKIEPEIVERFENINGFYNPKKKKKVKNEKTDHA
jgi:ethanolamine ammonia-lyase large subunit